MPGLLFRQAHAGLAAVHGHAGLGAGRAFDDEVDLMATCQRAGVLGLKALDGQGWRWRRWGRLGMRLGREQGLRQRSRGDPLADLERGRGLAVVFDLVAHTDGVGAFINASACFGQADGAGHAVELHG